MLEQPKRNQVWNQPHFVLNLPRRLAGKMAKNSLEDPLFRQFVPLIDEKRIVQGFNLDPVGDSSARCSQKLLRKYNWRVLLVTTSACAMHCRYCFRQNFDYAVQPGFEQELEEIQADISISEVILSGGDPLSLSDQTLAALLDKLSSIDHVKIIRFHTRFPIGIPERINESFLNILSSLRPKVVFVLHCNHPNELDSDVIGAMTKLQKLGIPILNQSVLLKGVNDDLDTLTVLSEALISSGIMPYYLHQLDRVQGTAHFEVEEKKGLELIQALTERLPGYAVPRYVQEIAGEKSKSRIDS